jgi:hypothetical protein
MLNRTQYPSDIIALVVLWRLRYRLTLRDLPEIASTPLSPVGPPPLPPTAPKRPMILFFAKPGTTGRPMFVPAPVIAAVKTTSASPSAMAA